MKTLREIPAIRALAGRQTADLVDALHAHRGMLSDHTEGALVEAQLDLLWDLERPASRDAIARLIAEVIGWDAFDVTKAVESSAEMLAGLYRVAGLPELPRWEPVPPPAEALRLIAIAVLGGPRG